MWIITSYNFMRWYTDKAAEVQMLQNLQKASKIVAVTVFKPGNRSKFLSVYLMLNQSDLWPPPPTIWSTHVFHVSCPPRQGRPRGHWPPHSGGTDQSQSLEVAELSSKTCLQRRQLHPTPGISESWQRASIMLGKRADEGFPRNSCSNLKLL